MDTSEKDFEATIVERLCQDGYTQRLPAQYDAARCLDPEALFAFIQTTQLSTWEKLKKQHGEQVRERFLERLGKELVARGTLDVLRKGVTDLGCKFQLAYFGPETSYNQEHQRLYRANIVSVTRQVRFSQQSGDSLDLVLFLNGLPIITAELKNPLKGQTVEHAIVQYRQDRDPKEPLFAFGRCLAHFAVDTDLVFMTAQLRGAETEFLPFNQGDNGGAGNPPNPEGFKTAYLWERIWQRYSLLDIVNQYVQMVDLEDDKGKKTGQRVQIFPRYHQLDAVRRLIGQVGSNGAGHNYLIQHSAGSGKSNSIAWLCHQLAGLHDSSNQRLFHSVVVITDRRVLDRQLKSTIRSFAQVSGVVKSIEGHKSKELAEALEAGKHIIVTTLQTFPFVTEKIGSLEGRRFAVVIDEAHSSQSGEDNAPLKQVLAAGSLDEAEREDAGAAEAPDAEDRLNAVVEAAQRQRGRLPNVSFFAFTATPKSKTLELFGTPGPDGKPRAFSLYSMRQAIEEGFILDVLQNYRTHKVYFSLLKRVEDDPAYDRKKANALLKSYVAGHEHAVRQKVTIMVDHFHDLVSQRIDSEAKAMVVTRSRLHAVRYKQEFDRTLKRLGYPYRALVAFSGSVTDPDSGETFTEAGMNGLPESQTVEAFKKQECRFLIVAEKFQTGFDQPLLHTMYVDKKLEGVHAVQTLSRLNRTRRGKEDTFVLDFVNEADAIRSAFEPFYEATLLSETTDPNKLYDLKRLIDEHHIFAESEVDAFAQVYFSPKAKQAQLHPVLNAVMDEFQTRGQEEQADFRKRLADYVRLYAFLSQVLPFTDADLEKFYQFVRHLARKLPSSGETLPVEITQHVNMDAYRIQQTSTGSIKLLGDDNQLHPISELGSGAWKKDEKTPLSQILTYINETFGTEFTAEDKVRHFAEDVGRRLDDHMTLRLAYDPNVNPSADNRRMAFRRYFNEVLEDMIGANTDLYVKIKDDASFGKLFEEFVLKEFEERLMGTTR